MLIYEYEAKQLYLKYGIPVSPSILLENPIVSKGKQSEDNIIKEIKNDVESFISKAGEIIAIKAQVLSGGRGKRGLIKIGKGIDDILEKTKTIFTTNDPKDGISKRVLLEKGVEIEQEIYLSTLLDRTEKKIMIMVSLEGGVDIENVSRTQPDAIKKMWIDVTAPITEKIFYEILNMLEINDKKKEILAKVLKKMTQMLKTEELMLLEINPFVFNQLMEPLALDARVFIDSNAIFRHPEQKKFVSIRERLSPQEKEAHKSDIAYVELSGNLGMISCGAGLSMATCDMLSEYRVEPANFLDVGGGASPEKVSSALNILFKQPHINGILINVFGGITRCDDVARGIITSLSELSEQQKEIPIVVRLIGTNDKEGVNLLSNNNIHAFTDMDKAVKKIVEVVLQ